MSREFIAVHPTNGKFVLIRKGEKGYIEYPCTQTRADQVNDVNGNTSDDIDAAVTCSMFGWNLPIAKTL